MLRKPPAQYAAFESEAVFFPQRCPFPDDVHGGSCKISNFATASMFSAFWSSRYCSILTILSVAAATLAVRSLHFLLTHQICPVCVNNRQWLFLFVRLFVLLPANLPAVLACEFLVRRNLINLQNQT
ncbi:MAG: hypothetical protein Ta2F_16070 [Termitinemataceae bacterium]|nr:MAG: hypothetical protein Ta2F_16070 [Termitinemataceae bacterium]